MTVTGGGTICLPYLTALIRLSDEIDVTAARNPAFLYDLESITEETSARRSWSAGSVMYSKYLSKHRKI